jgi:hypothetical protein
MQSSIGTACVTYHRLDGNQELACRAVMGGQRNLAETSISIRRPPQAEVSESRVVAACFVTGTTVRSRYAGTAGTLVHGESDIANEMG